MLRGRLERGRHLIEDIQTVYLTGAGQMESTFEIFI